MTNIMYAQGVSTKCSAMLEDKIFVTTRSSFSHTLTHTFTHSIYPQTYPYTLIH